MNVFQIGFMGKVQHGCGNHFLKMNYQRPETTLDNYKLTWIVKPNLSLHLCMTAPLLDLQVDKDGPTYLCNQNNDKYIFVIIPGQMQF